MSDYTHYPPSPPSVVPNSSMAIVSLLAGILGLTLFPFLGSIVAVITGPMAKREIVQSAGTLGGEGLATAGTILGWIGIGIGVIGFCIGGVTIALPFCLGIFGIAASEWSDLLQMVVAVL